MEAGPLVNPRLAEARGRIRAWLAGEAADRPVILGRVRPRVPLPEPAGLEEAWLDVDARIERVRRDVERGGWFAEGIPSFFVNLGPGVLAGFATGKYRLGPETIWFPRAVESLDEILGLAVDREGRLFRTCLELTRRSLREGRGRWTTSITDLGGVTDVVASLRGNERLLIDLVEHPDAVRAGVAHIGRLWKEVFADLWAEVRAEERGCATWLLPWSDGSHYPLQCDFSSMIGPDMFRTFVLPELRDLAATLDHPIYHLDGPDAVRHLPAILSIEGLRAVQWIPGAGSPPPIAWPDVIRKIRAAGRSVYTYGTPDEVIAMTRLFGARGMLYQLDVADADEGDRLLLELEASCRTA